MDKTLSRMPDKKTPEVLFCLLFAVVKTYPTCPKHDGVAHLQTAIPCQSNETNKANTMMPISLIWILEVSQFRFRHLFIQFIPHILVWGSCFLCLTSPPPTSSSHPLSHIQRHTERYTQRDLVFCMKSRTLRSLWRLSHCVLQQIRPSERVWWLCCRLSQGSLILCFAIDLASLRK